MLTRLLAAALAFISFSVGALAEHPWPMYHRSLARTGQSGVPGPQYVDLKWAADLGATVVNYGSPVLDENGRAYVGTGDGLLHAINPDGTSAWTYDTGAVQQTFDGGLNTPSPAIAPDGTVYVLDAKARLHKLSAAGGFQWRYDSPGNTADSHPAVLGSGDVIVAVYQYIPPRSANAYLISVSPTKTVNWSVPNLGVGHVLSGPAVDESGNVYVAAFQNLYKYTGAGGYLWTYTNPTHIYNTPALGPGGLVVLADQSGYMLRVDRSTGSDLPPLSIGSVSQAPPAVGADGYAVAAAWPNQVVAMDTATGDLLWSYTTTGTPQSAPSLDSRDNAYFGVGDGMIYALDRHGRRLWTLDMGTATRSTPGIDSAGNLYIGTDTPSGARLLCFSGAYDTGKTIGGARTLGVGSSVTLPGKFVTYAGSGFFYVQDWDSTSGIRVISTASVAVGDVVKVSGTLGTDWVEDAVVSASVEKIGTGLPPPVRYLRGSAIGGVGANTVGLLVRTSGVVGDSSQQPDGSWTFSIQDGSSPSGVLVHSPSAPPAGYVSVTGVISRDIYSGHAVLLTRTSADVQGV